jgi:hypothetical protein
MSPRKSGKTMKWNTVSEIVKSSKAPGVKVQEQKNFYQLTGARGAKLYIAKPGKLGDVTRVDLSGFAYCEPGEYVVPGTDVKVPCKAIDNGAAARLYNPDSDEGRALRALVARLDDIEPEARPSRRGRQSGPGVQHSASDLG